MRPMHHPVQLILFSTVKGPGYQEILAVATALFPPGALQVPDSLETFGQVLGEIGSGHRIILALLGNRDDLSRMLAFRDLLRDRPLILVLPDSDTGTMTRGAALYPRYIGNVQDHLTDVCHVLEKMVHNVQHRVNDEKKGPVRF